MRLPSHLALLASWRSSLSQVAVSPGTAMFTFRSRVRLIDCGAAAIGGWLLAPCERGEQLCSKQNQRNRAAKNRKKFVHNTSARPEKNWDFIFFRNYALRQVGPRKHCFISSARLDIRFVHFNWPPNAYIKSMREPPETYLFFVPRYLECRPGGHISRALDVRLSNTDAVRRESPS